VTLIRVALASALLYVAPARAEEPPATTLRTPDGTVTITPSPGHDPSQADTVRLNFPVDSSLMSWVRFFADLRGMNFVIPNASDLENVKVTIISNQDVSPDAAWEAFLSALAVEGYALGVTGQTAKIVEVGSVRAGRLGTGQPADSDAWLTQLFEVRTSKVEDLAAVFSNLMGPDTKIVAHRPTNTLIVTGTAANLRTIHELLRGLDVPKPALTVESYALEHADAAEVQQLIEQVYGDDPRYGIEVFVTPD
jgi:general secretion pathway protein D